MAFLHNAQLVPSKLELLAGWLPSQLWWPGGEVPAASVGAYRLDDPADEVGLETHLLSVGGRTVQVPLTYRGAPLDGAEDALVGTLQHGVLGQRWVYDACSDPVYAAALATIILTGGVQADLMNMVDGRLERREPTTFATGSGTVGSDVPPIGAIAATSDENCTTIHSDGLELVVRRTLDGDRSTAGAQTLTGRWPGHDGPALLALARRI
ncbi:MAG: hypothetical protein ABI301_07115 [Jatrophihabitantaceae bacterium]